MVNELLRGELQIDAKSLNFRKFEKALCMKSLNILLSRYNFKKKILQGEIGKEGYAQFWRKLLNCYVGAKK